MFPQSTILGLAPCRWRTRALSRVGALAGTYWARTISTTSAIRGEAMPSIPRTSTTSPSITIGRAATTLQRIHSTFGGQRRRPISPSITNWLRSRWADLLLHARRRDGAGPTFVRKRHRQLGTKPIRRERHLDAAVQLTLDHHRNKARSETRPALALG